MTSPSFLFGERPESGEEVGTDGVEEFTLVKGGHPERRGPNKGNVRVDDVIGVLHEAVEADDRPRLRPRRGSTSRW